MRIKRTFAPTMREALALVKQEQGPDAVILGNKKVPGGVEILSAVDFDHQRSDAYQGNPAAAMGNPAAATRSPSSEPMRQAVGAANPAADDLAAAPDFLLDPQSGGRREPVLGIVSPRSPVATAARADAAARASTAAGTAKQVRRRSAPPPTLPGKTAPATPRRPARGLPVEEEALLRARQGGAAQTRPKPRDELVERLRNRPFEPREAAGPPSAPPSGQESPEPLIHEVKDELKNLRDLMQSQLNILEWDRYNERHPVRSVLLNLMTELGLGSDVCELIFDQLGALSNDPHKVWQQALGLLARAIPIDHNDILSRGGRIALVGSTGVGKTTTIAKLAARFAHAHGKHTVGLISTDHYRIGAQEQLQQFARMIEVPLLTAANREELADRLQMLADKRLVLIDTAGMSQRDLRLSEQFHELHAGAPEVKTYLVLSANTQLAALDETIRNFGKVRLGGGIVTKIDESASLGAVITAAIRYKLPLSYCGTGQRVPEDLRRARNHQLVSKAVSLMQKYSEQVDKDTLAFRYHNIISKHPH